MKKKRRRKKKKKKKKKKGGEKEEVEKKDDIDNTLKDIDEDGNKDQVKFGLGKIAFVCGWFLSQK